MKRKPQSAARIRAKSMGERKRSARSRKIALNEIQYYIDGKKKRLVVSLAGNA